MHPFFVISLTPISDDFTYQERVLLELPENWQNTIGFPHNILTLKCELVFTINMQHFHPGMRKRNHLALDKAK